MEKLLTIKEAAALMKVSQHTITRLVNEAEVMPRRARWKEKRDYVNLAPSSSAKRIIRILPSALMQ